MELLTKKMCIMNEEEKLNEKIIKYSIDLTTLLLEECENNDNQFTSELKKRFDFEKIKEINKITDKLFPLGITALEGTGMQSSNGGVKVNIENEGLKKSLDLIRRMNNLYK